MSLPPPDTHPAKLYRFMAMVRREQAESLDKVAKDLESMPSISEDLRIELWRQMVRNHPELGTFEP